MRCPSTGKWIGLGCLSVAVFIAPAMGEEWSPVADSEARLVFSGPGLENSAARRTRKRGEGYIAERAVWQSGIFPIAEIQVIELGMKRVFIAESIATLQDQIRSSFEAGSVKFHEDGSLDNVLGRVYFQRFDVEINSKIVECVGVRQFFGSAVFDIVVGYGASANILGSKMILGWYCVSPLVGIDNKTIGAVARGIGFRGYAVPPDVMTETPGLGTAQELPPAPPIVSTGGDFEDYSCADEEVFSRPICQEWRRKLDAWKQQQEAR